ELVASGADEFSPGNLGHLTDHRLTIAAGLEGAPANRKRSHFRGGVLAAGGAETPACQTAGTPRSASDYLHFPNVAAWKMPNTSWGVKTRLKTSSSSRSP